MLDVRKLRVLQELSARGTLAETADVLGYTPSAVSQQLTALEKECGHRLLLKQGRTVALTPKARILVEHTEKILHELTLAQTALESTDDSPRRHRASRHFPDRGDGVADGHARGPGRHAP